MYVHGTYPVKECSFLMYSFPIFNQLLYFKILSDIALI